MVELFLLSFAATYLTKVAAYLLWRERERRQREQREGEIKS